MTVSEKVPARGEVLLLNYTVGARSIAHHCFRRLNSTSTYVGQRTDSARTEVRACSNGLAV